MQTLTINIPEGFRIKSFDEKTGEVSFEPVPKDIKERINSLQDIFELNNTTQEDFDNKWKGFEPHEKAAALEILIVAAYNEGKLPDFTDGTYKYYPRFKMGSPSGLGFSYFVCVRWNSLSTVGSRLVFHGKNGYENMLDAVEKFLPQYKDSRTL
ncbi:hypothetical protein HX004_14175 [Myroides sp. 1354]|uniref:hypothetical protein n=1 Tax=unclassified Myroides TaxID=2642485 RepID=UPI0025760331|nr:MULTISPECIES: hypothetical protein [unclassified Myroides]MDM1045902.1 hypothetical protein [Myroides sp. R163-1]MDM1056912.1 hypothetical protein [Myroides sp. 1354]MDM1070107.1 hypothetical protein [Myroides sp. 1372]